jgi:hypothetical protein
MAQSFLIFDFGTNEETAQQARHTIDRWKQGFRLDKKMLLKFDRKDADAESAKEDAKARLANGDVLIMVRLDFSDHERLSHQRWLNRIPTEAPFKDAHPKVISADDAEFARAAKRFDTLD